VYFADTYALIEILRGNPEYRKYSDIVTGEGNLWELGYVLVRNFGEEKARGILATVRSSVPVITPSVDDIVVAGRLLLDNGHKFSLTDALGYAIALNRGLKYLTGDVVFMDLDNVEWVE